MDAEALILDELERRVLGVLLEKDFTQPQAYPMTLNAITAACNQKSNRDPLMELDDDTVWDTLSRLRERGWVTRILPQPGGRVDKFKHAVPEKLSWQSPLRAVMTELLLRGSQTPGELRSRCARFTPFESLESVMQVLETAMRWSPPLVRILPRGGGQSADRYAHCLYAEGADASLPSASAAATRAGAPAAASVGAGGDVDSLRDELAHQRQEIAALQLRLARVEQQVGITPPHEIG